MPNTNHYDIIIVGAGPAGISTALHLARTAADLVSRTLILEKARHPRHKLCAGGLVVDAEAILQKLGLDVTEIPHVDISRAHFLFEGQGLSIRPARTHALRVIRRDEFDAWLVEKARQRCIAIQEETTVLQVTPTDSEVIVMTSHGEFRSQVLVGADGSNGIVRRCILPDEATHTARTLETLAPPNEASSHGKKEAYFDFFCVPHGITGYTWDFPTQVKGRPMRCWGIYDSNISPSLSRAPLKNTLAGEMERHGYHLDDPEVQGHPIRWFDPFGSFSIRRVILAGDSAGADALFGEGISMALGWGEIAAKSIRAAFAHQDFSFRDYRRRILCSAMGMTLAMRTLFTHILYRLSWRAFQRFLWQRMGWLISATAWLFVIHWAKRQK